MSEGLIAEVLYGEEAYTVEIGTVGGQGPIGPSGTVIQWTGTAWPARPSSVYEASVVWVGGTTPPPGALDDDIWILI